MLDQIICVAWRLSLGSNGAFFLFWNLPRRAAVCFRSLRSPFFLFSFLALVKFWSKTAPDDFLSPFSISHQRHHLHVVSLCFNSRSHFIARSSINFSTLSATPSFGKTLSAKYSNHKFNIITVSMRSYLLIALALAAASISVSPALAQEDGDAVTYTRG